MRHLLSMLAVFILCSIGTAGCDPFGGCCESSCKEGSCCQTTKNHKPTDTKFTNTSPFSLRGLPCGIPGCDCGCVYTGYCDCEKKDRPVQKRDVDPLHQPTPAPNPTPEPSPQPVVVPTPTVVYYSTDAKCRSSSYSRPVQVLQSAPQPLPRVSSVPTYRSAPVVQARPVQVSQAYRQPVYYPQQVPQPMYYRPMPMMPVMMGGGNSGACRT